MILIDPRLLEQLEKSTCFGKAYSPDAKECKKCDLQQECMAKTQGNSIFDQYKQLSPETKQEMSKVRQMKLSEVKKIVKKNEKREESDNSNVIDIETKKPIQEEPEKKPKKKKKKKPNPPGMPVTKNMTVEELWKLVNERGGTCKEYSDERIQKMQLVMALKRTYEQ